MGHVCIPASTAKSVFWGGDFICVEAPHNALINAESNPKIPPGELYLVANSAYGLQVDFCPFCGAKAKVPVSR
jgi:hypothetical protein